MFLGNLVIYDLNGKIFSQSGESEGNVAREYPLGIPYIELTYGFMEGKKLISIDVSKEVHEPIFETVPVIKPPSVEIELLKQENEQVRIDLAQQNQAFSDFMELFFTLNPDL